MMTQEAARRLWLAGACGVYNLYIQHSGCFLCYMLYTADQRVILPYDCDNYGNCHGELGVNSMFHAGCGRLCRFAFVHYYCINAFVILTRCFVWSSSCFYRAEYHILCDTASKFSMFLIILFDYIFLNLFLSLCCYCCAASPSYENPQIPFMSVTCCKKTRYTLRLVVRLK